MSQGCTKMLGIRHVALRVRDVEASVRFYTEVLKMRIEWRPDPMNAYLTSGSDNLALHQVESELAPADAQSLDHFGFVVSTAGEVDAWAAEIEGRGVELVQRPKTHRDGARSFYFRDPDGNLIQLIWIPYAGTRDPGGQSVGSRE